MVFRKEKAAQRERYRAGYSADMPGSFRWTCSVKNFGHSLESLKKKQAACRSAHPWPEIAVFFLCSPSTGAPKEVPHKRFRKMISLNTQNLESILLAEPHGEVMFCL